MAHLVTGYAGHEHIKSADDGAFNAAFFGQGQFVMESGSMFGATIIDNNTIRISDGDLLMDGRHVRIEPSAYEDIAIESGSTGMKRYDLICMTYEKDGTTGTERAFLEVIKGKEATNPTRPSVQYASILEGATKSQMPLYLVEINGIALARIVELFGKQPNYVEMAERYRQEFVQSCRDHLDSLNVLDSMNEVKENTERHQIAGALALKEFTDAKQISDLNIKENGWYKFLGSANGSPTTSSGGVLWVCNATGGYGAQFAITNLTALDSEGKLFWTRNFTSEGFGKWSRYALASDVDSLFNTLDKVSKAMIDQFANIQATFKDNEQVHRNLGMQLDQQLDVLQQIVASHIVSEVTDLNTKKDGTYFYKSTASNVPGTMGGLLMVRNTTPGYGVQLAISNSNVLDKTVQTIWTRCFTESGYGTWTRYARNEDVSAFDARIKALETVETITDLNIKTNGIYKFAGTANGVPSTAAGGVMWVCNSLNGYGSQFVITNQTSLESEGKIFWTRNFTNDGFGKWTKYASSADVTALREEVNSFTYHAFGTLQIYFDAASVRCANGVKRLYMNGLKSGVTMTAGTAYPVYQIPEEKYHPTRDVVKYICIGADKTASHMAKLTISSAGVVTITPYSDRTDKNLFAIDECYI